MMRRDFLLHAAALAGCGALAACASIDSVKDARGKGIKRTYKQPYDEVYDATLAAAAGKKLELVSATRATGTVLLSSGASLGSLGERIAVFVSRLGDRVTSVEVVSRPVVSTLSFPPDWPMLLFGEIEEELAKRRLRK
jgi:hypothetical protein